MPRLFDNHLMKNEPHKHMKTLKNCCFGIDKQFNTTTLQQGLNKKQANDFQQLKRVFKISHCPRKLEML